MKSTGRPLRRKTTRLKVERRTTETSVMGFRMRRYARYRLLPEEAAGEVIVSAWREPRRAAVLVLVLVWCTSAAVAFATAVAAAVVMGISD